MGKIVPLKKTVYLGGLAVGGRGPIAVMAALSSIADIEEAGREIRELKADGADIIAVPIEGRGDLSCLEKIVRQMEPAGGVGPLLVSAEPSLDVRLLLDLGVSAFLLEPVLVLLNTKKFAAMLRVLHEHNAVCFIRSTEIDPPAYRAANSGNTRAAVLVASIKDQLRVLESHGFSEIVVSVMHSDTPASRIANQRLAREICYPLHLTFDNPIAVAALLRQGIGDSVHIPNADPIESVKKAIRSIGPALPARQ